MANASTAPETISAPGFRRMGALLLSLLMFLSACATVTPSRESLETRGEGEAVFAMLPTDFEPVRVSDAEFQGALSALVLDMPLRVASSCPPLYVGRKLALASASQEGAQWRSELARAYGRFCERRGTPGDCLTLFDDGPDLQAKDKRSIALSLAVGPALEARDAQLRAMLSSTQLWTTVSITLSAYLALLVMPEPVSKGVASVLTLVMWGYLGWEFFDLIRAYVRLAEESERATTFEELREAGERFGKVIGPNSVRILVMLGTAALGDTAALMSKGPKLPGFGQASRAVEVRTGMRLMDAAAGTERVIMSIPEGTLRIVLPANAFSMTAGKGTGGPPASSGSGTPRQGRLLPSGHRAFKSFDAFKDFMGPAGKDRQWHHIVEQHQGNLQRFGPEALHNTENVVSIDGKIHVEINRFYSSRQAITGNKVVREWLRTQSYEQQRAFGLMILKRFGVIP